MIQNIGVTHSLVKWISTRILHVPIEYCTSDYRAAETAVIRHSRSNVSLDFLSIPLSWSSSISIKC